MISKLLIGLYRGKEAAGVSPRMLMTCLPERGERPKKSFIFTNQKDLVVETKLRPSFAISGFGIYFAGSVCLHKQSRLRAYRRECR